MFAPPARASPAGLLQPLAPLGDRLTAGQRILALLIKVRILVPQLRARARPAPTSRTFLRFTFRFRQLAVASLPGELVLLFVLASRNLYSSRRSSTVASRPHRLAVRTPASHVGNTGSIPVGVATTARICERIRWHEPLLADSEPLPNPSDDPARARLSDIKAALDRGDFDWASKLLEVHRALAAVRTEAPAGASVVDLASRRTHRE